MANNPATKTGKVKKVKHPARILAGVLLLILIPVVGSTFAANLSVNSGTPIQFSQGVVAAVGCDNDGVTVTPSSTFTNNTASASATGTFAINTIAVTGIAAGCDGHIFTIKIYSNTSLTPQTVAATITAAPSPSSAASLASTTVTTTAIKVLWKSNGTYPAIAARLNSDTSEPWANYTIAGDSSSFTVTLATTLTTDNVNKFTVETA